MSKAPAQDVQAVLRCALSIEPTSMMRIPCTMNHEARNMKELEFDWRADAMRNEFWKTYRKLPFVDPSLWEKFKKRMEDEGRLTKGTSHAIRYQP